MILFPLGEALTLIPLGTELVMGLVGWNSRLPIFLVLSLAECAAILGIYHVSLNWQGGLLQAREQAILESVTDRSS
jgi:hypothetical protein